MSYKYSKGFSGRVRELSTLASYVFLFDHRTGRKGPIERSCNGPFLRSELGELPFLEQSPATFWFVWITHLRANHFQHSGRETRLGPQRMCRGRSRQEERGQMYGPGTGTCPIHSTSQPGRGRAQPQHLQKAIHARIIRTGGRSARLRIWGKKVPERRVTLKSLACFQTRRQSRREGPTSAANSFRFRLSCGRHSELRAR
jgi:hypothetical protein